MIEETSEIIEPYERAGNFHSVTICYLGKVLWMYVDHVPYDGTGVKSVLETFFYHYYCELDKKEYPVPEGVFTEKDGVVAGQDTDAYLMSDSIDPKAMTAAFGKSESFEIKEAFRDEVFSKREDCRGYCISVPGDELMTYAKSVKGSPMFLLAVFLAKAMQKVHPENKLPGTPVPKEELELPDASMLPDDEPIKRYDGKVMLVRRTGAEWRTILTRSTT